MSNSENFGLIVWNTSILAYTLAYQLVSTSSLESTSWAYSSEGDLACVCGVSGKLEATKRYVTLDDDNYAVAESCPDGQVKHGYCLIQKLSFFSENCSAVLYTCICPEAS